MINILDLQREVESKGYKNIKEITAKVSQDIILMMIASSELKRNVTIKGGVVMQSLSKNIRRATLDLDLDFIHFPITDDGIKQFINTLNKNEDFKIGIIGKIKPLKHENYKGKNISVNILDTFGNNINTTIDIGVHKNFVTKQNIWCFDVSTSNKSVSLLIDSVEQIFVEKLNSLLRFSILSTRYKDVYDMYYLIKYINKDKLIKCLDVIVFSKKGKYQDISSIYMTLKEIFKNNYYLNKIKTSKKNWLGVDNNIVFKGLLSFFSDLIY